MRANSISDEYKVAKGAFLKNAYIRDGKSEKDPVKKTYKIAFDLCTAEDKNGEMVETVNATCFIHVNAMGDEAFISVNGELQSLVPYLLGGGQFIEQDLVSYGRVAYEDLGQWFIDGFEPLEFVQSGVTFYAKIWILQHLTFHDEVANGKFLFE